MGGHGGHVGMTSPRTVTRRSCAATGIPFSHLSVSSSAPRIEQSRPRLLLPANSDHLPCRFSPVRTAPRRPATHSAALGHPFRHATESSRIHCAAGRAPSPAPTSCRQPPPTGLEDTARRAPTPVQPRQATPLTRDRKSTRLNSSHSGESRMPSSA